MEQRTPWFGSNKPPVRAGWYEAKGGFVDGDVVMRYWTGDGWKWKPPGRDGVIYAALGSADKWRGLSNNPLTALDKTRCIL